MTTTKRDYFRESFVDKIVIFCKYIDETCYKLLSAFCSDKFHTFYSTKKVSSCFLKLSQLSAVQDTFYDELHVIESDWCKIRGEWTFNIKV